MAGTYIQHARGRAGVTLIEVLIAMSLLSILSVGILMAMRVGLNALGKANNKLISNRRAAGAQRILEQQIEGLMPVLASCRPGAEAPAIQMPFFQGEPQSMRFVSSYSLQEAARGYPRILEFQVIPGADGRGVRLVVNEHIYSGPLAAGFFCLGRSVDPALGIDMPRFRPIQTGTGSFVLADQLAFCHFAYQDVDRNTGLDQWLPLWTSLQWPRGVRVEMAPLDADPGRLRVLPVTAAIHVNRHPNLQYVDQ
jgi:prepilin-type N-terminal cleavage/methylation domain-containing protein